jgi:hypothetical protein
MTVLFPHAGVPPEQLAADARRLADDLAALVSGAPPSRKMLADAPILDQWAPAVRRNGALTGLITGHPRIVDGHSALTTDLFAIDSYGLFARTWSRFYRLGRPALQAHRRPQ